jgi:hypothetical protein
MCRNYVDQEINNLSGGFPLKCELPSGCRIHDPIRVFEPGLLPESLQKRIEEFRFPLSEYPSPAEREKELDYDRMYLKRSVYVIYYSPFDFTSFVAVARIIEKRTPEEKLPVEFATVFSTTVDSKTSPKRDINGGLFPVDYYDNRFPVCEIGGLRAAEIDPAKGITLKARYRAIDEVMKQCDKQVHDRGYKSFFLTCMGTPHMERLYHDKFFFDEVSTITYNNSAQPWKALWRTPFHNPVKKIEYSYATTIPGPDFCRKNYGVIESIIYTDEDNTVHTRENEATTITNNGAARKWKCLWKWPLHTALKKIEYSKAA